MRFFNKTLNQLKQSSNFNGVGRNLNGIISTTRYCITFCLFNYLWGIPDFVRIKREFPRIKWFWKIWNLQDAFLKMKKNTEFPRHVHHYLNFQSYSRQYQLNQSNAESIERNRMIAIRLSNTIETQSNITQDLPFDCQII